MPKANIPIAKTKFIAGARNTAVAIINPISNNVPNS